jgi:hypothetical protein
MNRGVFVGAATIAMALSIAASPRDTRAATIAPPPARAIEAAGLAKETAIFCGPYGCGPIWSGPRRRRWDWGPWDHVYRPACPIGYYYACQRGPLGYGQCACWAYRAW